GGLRAGHSAETAGTGGPAQARCDPGEGGAGQDGGGGQQEASSPHGTSWLRDGIRRSRRQVGVVVAGHRLSSLWRGRAPWAPAGAGVGPRTTKRGSRVVCRARSSPRSRAVRRPRATRPRSSSGAVTVVSGGEVIWARSRPSEPTTDRSEGTLQRADS